MIFTLLDKGNIEDVTYALMEGYCINGDNGDIEIKEYVVVRNPVEEGNGKWHWDSGDYYTITPYFHQLTAKANAYSALCEKLSLDHRAKAYEQQFYAEAEEKAKYLDLLQRTVTEYLYQLEDDKENAKKTLIRELDLEDDIETQKLLGIYTEMYEKREVTIRYTKECEYKTSIYVPVDTDDDEIENYFDNKVDFEELYAESETEDYEYSICKRNWSEYTLEEATKECEWNGDYILDKSEF